MSLRDAAVHVVRVLAEAGHVAYFAGGCVRDRLMGHEPTDYDVATDARPEAIRQLFRRTHSVGESFGVMLVRHGGHVIEVATFRTDGEYADGRHPESVTFSDAEHDARRRDFTINGLFEDPLDGTIIDHVGGQADLEARVIRAIGSPADRFREDHLRLLRAVRFAARFTYAIDPETADAIRRTAADLTGVSRERIGQEMKRMLSHPNRAVAAWELQYLGLDAPVLDEPTVLVAPTRLGRLDDGADYHTALAAWVLDRHDGADEKLDGVAGRWAERLMLSNVDRAAFLSGLDVQRVLVRDWWQLGVARQKRLAASGPFQAGLALVKAADRQLFVDIRRRVLELSETGLAPMPLIDGADLIAIGLEPGPVFKQVLGGVYDAQLEGAISTPEQALDLARAIAATCEDR
jgi:poly(A) polymerase